MRPESPLLTGDVGARDAAHIDLGCCLTQRMGKEGTRFTQFYVASPICSPSRCGIITAWTKVASSPKPEGLELLDGESLRDIIGSIPGVGPKSKPDAKPPAVGSGGLRPWTNVESDEMTDERAGKLHSCP